MKVKNFLDLLGVDFYTGVPDSLLRSVYDYLIKYKTDKQHIIAVNEGSSIAIAAGYHLSTGKIPLIYMQNSGIGNALNPLASLMNDKVYAIPCILLVGYRGEVGVHDEPQHIFQGEITEDILNIMNIDYCVVDKNTTEKEISEKMIEFRKKLASGKQVCFLIKKGSLVNDEKNIYSNPYTLMREDALKEILNYTEDNPIVSTTGKTSREIFEIREKNRLSHKFDFLTVGSMGHASSIALGIALNKPNLRIWCIDGDGAMLMHMGVLATIGTRGIDNMVHILINNTSHESVGGAPTCMDSINICDMAKLYGYKKVYTVSNMRDLKERLESIVNSDKILTFLEIKCAIGSRKDLGRPTISPIENKENFMKNFV